MSARHDINTLGDRIMSHRFFGCSCRYVHHSDNILVYLGTIYLMCINKSTKLVKIYHYLSRTSLASHTLQSQLRRKVYVACETRAELTCMYKLEFLSIHLMLDKQVIQLVYSACEL